MNLFTRFISVFLLVALMISFPAVVAAEDYDSFQTFLELKTICESSSESTDNKFMCTGQVLMEEDLTIPPNFHVILVGLEIPEGVTLNVSEGTYLQVTTLTVNGTLNNRGGVSVQKWARSSSLEAEIELGEIGYINNDGYIVLPVPLPEDSISGTGQIFGELTYTQYSDLTDAISHAEENSEITYRLYITDSEVTQEDNLKIPHNLWISLSDSYLTVPEGKTLELGGVLFLYTSVVHVYGTLQNQYFFTAYDRDSRIEIEGSYSGNGSIYVNGVGDYFPLSGIDQNHYEFDKASGNWKPVRSLADEDQNRPSATDPNDVGSEIGHPRKAEKAMKSVIVILLLIFVIVVRSVLKQKKKKATAGENPSNTTRNIVALSVSKQKKTTGGGGNSVVVIPKNLQVGDTVKLGCYPQSSAGQYLPIEWTVLEVTDSRALLLSRFILDAQPFHTEEGSVFWNSSSLRSWLNNDFLPKAFKSEELKLIYDPGYHVDLPLEEELWRTQNVETETADLLDRVFLLRWSDVGRYFPSEQKILNPGSSAKTTDYVKGKYSSEEYMAESPAWWLRTSFPSQPFACIVSPVDTVGFSRISPDNLQGIRPAFWLKLNNVHGKKPRRQAPEEPADNRFSIRVITGEETTEPGNTPFDGSVPESDFHPVFKLICNEGTTEEQQQRMVNVYASALLGDVLSAGLLGVAYYNGDVVKQDYEEAFRWYKVSAEGGIAAAQANLSDCYLQGTGVAQNSQKALEWMKKAAGQGDANAQANLGVWYLDGFLTEQNIPEGERLLRASAEQRGHNWEFAYDRLGGALMLHPDRKSKIEGLSYTTKAAEAGYPPAMEHLCKIYGYGLNDMNAFKNDQLAVQWAQQGAKVNQAFCQAALASWMAEGQNDEAVIINLALPLAHSSAEQDCSFGCFVSGVIHEKIHDFQVALEYYRKAVALGDKAAESDVQRMESALKNS